MYSQQVGKTRIDDMVTIRLCQEKATFLWERQLCSVFFCIVSNGLVNNIIDQQVHQFSNKECSFYYPFVFFYIFGCCYNNRMNIFFYLIEIIYIIYYLLYIIF